MSIAAPPVHIQLNGKHYGIAPEQTVAQLIRQLELGDHRYAIEVNGAIVPRGRHHDTILNPADRVEIVQAIGGG